MTDLQQEVLDIIEREIVFGFMEEDELLEEVLETFYDEDVNPKWIGEKVHEMYAERQDEIAEWDPEEASDFDRLANAFDELSERRIIAIHRAGFNEDDAIEELTSALKALGERSIRPKGYVYYHTGHLDQAIDPEKPVLKLVFGAMTKASTQVKEVGNLITATLQRYGLDARWDGGLGDPIRIKDIEWLKEPDEEEWGVERSVAIMSGEDEASEQREEQIDLEDLEDDDEA